MKDKMMKKVVNTGRFLATALFIALICGSVGATSAFAAVSQSFSPNSGTVARSQNLTVEVVIQGPNTVWGIDCYTKYDNNVFSTPTVTDHFTSGTWDVANLVNPSFGIGKIQFSKATSVGPGFGSVSSPTNIYKITFPVKADAPFGTTTIEVDTTANVYFIYDDGFTDVTGSTSKGTFVIQNPGPDITSCSPARYQGDTNTYVNVVGTNTSFVQGTTTAQIGGTGVTVGTVEVTTTTAAKVYITSISTSAATGGRDITLITTTEVATGEGLFVITAPSFASVTPTSGYLGDTITGVAIVGTGTHFGGTTTASLESNITVSNISVSDATHLTCTITIGATAATGTRDVSVTTGGETVTGTNVFTVNAIPSPVWASHYLVTSKEAVVDWGSVEAADHYVVEYKTVSGSTWASTEVLSTYKYNSSDPNPNCHLTGLTSSVTYEVRVKAKRNGVESSPSPEDTFYTLERPWVSHANVTTNEAYILWGPEVSTSELNIPNAVTYEARYRVKTPPGAWNTTIKPPLGYKSDVTMSVLNFQLTGLTPSTTYEVQMRAVGASGYSDWSPTNEVYTIRGPRWVDATVTSLNTANIFWENVAGVTQYEMMYSKAPTAEGGTTVTTSDAQRAVTGLDAYTTYYAKARTKLPGVSDWSPVKSFYTMPGPSWIAAYSTTTAQTMATWEGVAGITSYEVNYKATSETTWASWAPTPDPTVNYGGPITGLTGRTWYELRVRQHTGTNESTWSSIAYFYTIPAPNNVAWNGSTATTASITWESVDMGVGVMCSSYEVSWGLTPEAIGSGDAVTGNIYYTMSPLTTGQTYYVKVRARDDTNHGWSNWAPYPTLTVVATDQATVSGIDVTSGWRGTTVKITGNNFGATTGTVSFEGVTAQPGYWKNNEIAVSVPPNAVTGSNSVIVKTTAGATATSPQSFNVTDGGFVLDDFEGGVWQYATWEGTGSVTITKNYTGAQERTTYQSAECSGSNNFEIVGGVSTYGDLPTENGYDLSSCKKIKLWFKGNGTSNVATFELVESNQAPGNNPLIPLAAEVWKYNVPISMSAGWQQITINLTTEGTNKFVLDSFYTGNSALDLNRIKSYQILTSGGNPKSYAIDYIFATAESVTGIASCSPARYQGDTNTYVNVTGTSTHFIQGTTTAQIAGGGVTVGTVEVTSSTAAKVYITSISTSAATGGRNITLITDTEVATGEGLFVISAPSFTSVTPASGAQGATLTGVAIVGTGTHFGGTTTVDFGSNITVSNISVTNATHLMCDIAISTEAATGARSVVVTTGSETITGTNEFTVNAPSTGGQLIYEKAGGIMMAYPNPFDPNDKANPLKMLFNTATGEAVDIYIFDTNARIIYQRRNADPLAADRTVTWDGETSYGEVVENGLYLIRVVKDGKLVAKGKILVIKK